MSKRSSRRMWVQKERVRLPSDLAPTPQLLAAVQETQVAIYIKWGKNIKPGKTSRRRPESGDTGLLLGLNSSVDIEGWFSSQRDEGFTSVAWVPSVCRGLQGRTVSDWLNHLINSLLGLTHIFNYISFVSLNLRPVNLQFPAKKTVK